MEELDSQPALIQAVAKEDINAVDALLKKHVNVNVRGTGGYTALIIAAAMGNLSIAEKLLDAGAKPDIKSQDGWEMNALMASINEGHTDVAALLIRKGANIDNDYLVPFAASRGQTEIVRLLVAAGAKFDVEVDWEADFLTTRKMTALKIAVEQNYTDIADILKQAADAKKTGAPSLRKTIFSALAAPSGKSLIEAAENGDEAAVKELVKKGVKLEGKNHFGQTALMMAAKNGHSGIISLLLGAGAKVETRGSSGENALIWAMWYGHEDAALLLIDKGAPLTEKAGGDDHTALDIAVIYNVVKHMNEPDIKNISEKVLAAMLLKVSDPHVKGEALHTAVRYKNAKAVRMLVDAGADLNVRSKHFNLTPYESAMDPRMIWPDGVPADMVKIREILKKAETGAAANSQPRKPPSPKAP